MPGGSIWCVSASSTLHPFRMVLVLPSEMRGDGVAKLRGAGAAALIWGQHVPGGIDACERRLETLRGLRVADVLEHHHARENRRRRVDHVAPRDVGRRAVGRLEVGVGVAVAPARRETEAADETGRGV